MCSAAVCNDDDVVDIFDVIGMCTRGGFSAMFVRVLSSLNRSVCKTACINVACTNSRSMRVYTVHTLCICVSEFRSYYSDHVRTQCVRDVSAPPKISLGLSARAALVPLLVSVKHFGCIAISHVPST